MACSVCGDAGHNRRTHVEHPAPQPGGDLLDQLGVRRPIDAAELALPREQWGRDIETVELPDTPPRMAIVGEQGPEPVQVPGEDAPSVMGPDGVVSVCATCGDPVESEPCRKHQPEAWRRCVGPEFASSEVAEQDTPQVSEAPLTAEQEIAVYADEAEAAGLAAAIAQTLDEQGSWSVDAPSIQGQMTIVAEYDPEVFSRWFIASGVLGEQGPQFVPWRTPLGPAEQPRITVPGIYQLPAEQYHDPRVTGDWISNSDVKKLMQTCPAQFHYDREHGVRKVSDAFDFGHVAHNVVLGKGEAYRVFEPKKLDGRTKAGIAQKAEVDKARAEGFTPIYGDQFGVITAMAEAIRANPKANELLTQPGRPEQCLFWEELLEVTDPDNALYGQIVTVKRRAMVDYLPDVPDDPGTPIKVVDYKTADEVKPDDKMRNNVYDYGYHTQADTYEAACRNLLGREVEVVFLMQSKKPPHLITPIELDTPAMKIAAYENDQALMVWAECVATGNWPGYTEGVATSGVPEWIERQHDEEIH
jgi:hypothetical protein